MRTPPESSRRKLRAAAILQLVQGGLLEGGPFVGMIVLLALGIDSSAAGEHFSFVVPYFQDNLYLMMAMSGIADGLLSGAALVFLLLAWFGDSPILAGEAPRDAGASYPNTLPVSRS